MPSADAYRAQLTAWLVAAAHGVAGDHRDPTGSSACDGAAVAHVLAAAERSQRADGQPVAVLAAAR